MPANRYVVIDYLTGVNVDDKVFPSEEKAKAHRDKLLKEKLIYIKDYTKYNWLLFIKKLD